MLLEKLSRQQLNELIWRESFLLWMVDNKVKNEKELVMEFDNYRFLKDIYDDMSPIQTCRKASQIGFSTMMILKTLYLAKYKKFNIIYTLPTFGDVGQFVPSKVNAIIANNPLLYEWTKDKNSVIQKKVENGYIFYRGTFSQKSEKEKMESGVGIMLSSDLNVHDECFAEPVDVLTDKGWKDIRVITLEDNIATNNNGKVEWNNPYKVIKNDYTGEVYRLNGRSINMLVTPSHKFLTKPYYKEEEQSLNNIKDLHNSPAFQLFCNSEWESKTERYFILPEIKVFKKKQGSHLLPEQEVTYPETKYKYKAFCKFLGWYLTEGNISQIKGKPTGTIVITQKNKRYLKEIEDILKENNWKYWINKNKIDVYTFGFADFRLAYALKELGNSFEKYIPREFLNTSYGLREMLKAIQGGDGDERGVITTVSKEFADTIQEAYLRIGIKTTIRITTQKDRSTLYRIMKHKYNFTVFNRYKNRKKSGTIEIEQYSGKTHCLSIKNKTFLVRDKINKCPVWTGNCDRSDQTILEQYESRLDASKYKGRWYFSNPTTPNTLSQKQYAKSDQKHWFIKCEHCNEWQFLDYFESVEDYMFKCRKCHREIKDHVRKNGKWIKKYRDKEVSGYWISHMIAPWISARKIQESYENKTKQYFYNFVLGMPYIGSDIVIDQDAILRNIDIKEPNFLKNNVMGVDQGLKKHYVIGNKQGIFKVGVVDSWDDIVMLMKKYDVETAVFDALPDLTEPRKIRDQYPGRVWLCYFKKDVRKADFITWDQKTRTVFTDRTKIIQQTIDELIDKKTRFQMEAESLNEYVKHWKAMYKITEVDNLGLERDVWESSGEDHLVFATLYFKLALSKSGSGKVMEYGEDDKIYDNSAPDMADIAKKTIMNQYE